MNDLQSWLKAGAYLPAPLRDFHDQKDVFKTMHALVDPNNESIRQVNWIHGHCYVIDIFLWWMAKRGWTLQRSRANLEFASLDADIAAHKERNVEAFKRMMDERLPDGHPLVQAARHLTSPEGVEDLAERVHNSSPFKGMENL